MLIAILARQAARTDQRNRKGKTVAFTLATEWELDQAEPARDLTQRGTDIGLDDLADSPTIAAIVAQLASCGVDPGLAWPVLRRCAELAIKEPASRRHTAARRDPYLAILGLTPTAASAWMNIVTGTRRAGEKASPLLNRFHPESIPSKWLSTLIAA